MIRPNTAAAEAMPHSEAERKLDELRRLEDPIASLCSMAHIMGELLDGCLSGTNQTRMGDQINISLTSHELELISFAWNDVASRSGTLKRAYYGAIDGGAAR